MGVTHYSIYWAATLLSLLSMASIISTGLGNSSKWNCTHSGNPLLMSLYVPRHASYHSIVAILDDAVNGSPSRKDTRCIASQEEIRLQIRLSSKYLRRTCSHTLSSSSTTAQPQQTLREMIAHPSTTILAAILQQKRTAMF